MGIAADADGSIYVVAEPFDVVAKLTPDGPFATIAGKLSQSGYSGDGAAAKGAQLNFGTSVFRAGLAVDGGSGAYGGGTYDILGPTGTSLGYKTVAARAGDTVELFGVGFGPTSPTVPAGAAYSGAAPTAGVIQLQINNSPVVPAFSGLTSAGLYQINLVKIPAGLGLGDVPLRATAGGAQTPDGVTISLQ
jgi:uncharacterized protein (TIGR03437 family)